MNRGRGETWKGTIRQNHPTTTIRQRNHRRKMETWRHRRKMESRPTTKYTQQLQKRLRIGFSIYLHISPFTCMTGSSVCGAVVQKDEPALLIIPFQFLLYVCADCCCCEQWTNADHMSARDIVLDQGAHYRFKRNVRKVREYHTARATMGHHFC